MTQYCIICGRPCFNAYPFICDDCARKDLEDNKDLDDVLQECGYYE